MTERRGFWRKSGELFVEILAMLVPTIFGLILVALTTFGGTIAGLFFEVEDICSRTGCDGDALRDLLLKNLEWVAVLVGFVLFVDRLTTFFLTERPRRKRQAKEEQLRQEKLQESMSSLERRIIDRIDALDGGVNHCWFCRRRWKRRSFASRQSVLPSCGDSDAG